MQIEVKINNHFLEFAHDYEHDPDIHSVGLSTDGDNYAIVNDSKPTPNWPSGM